VAAAQRYAIDLQRRQPFQFEFLQHCRGVTTHYEVSNDIIVAAVFGSLFIFKYHDLAITTFVLLLLCSTLQ